MPHYEFFWPSILHGTREQRRGRSFRQALHQPNGWDVRGAFRTPRARQHGVAISTSEEADSANRAKVPNHVH